MCGGNWASLRLKLGFQGLSVGGMRHRGADGKGRRRDGWLSEVSFECCLLWFDGAGLGMALSGQISN